MTIVTMSYYVVVLLQDSIEDQFPKNYYSVSYGLGFYVMTFAGKKFLVKFICKGLSNV